MAKNGNRSLLLRSLARTLLQLHRIEHSSGGEQVFAVVSEIQLDSPRHSDKATHTVILLANQNKVLGCMQSWPPALFYSSEADRKKKHPNSGDAKKLGEKPSANNRDKNK